jgi:hypothetical protein
MGDPVRVSCAQPPNGMDYGGESLEIRPVLYEVSGHLFPLPLPPFLCQWKRRDVLEGPPVRSKLDGH